MRGALVVASLLLLVSVGAQTALAQGTPATDGTACTNLVLLVHHPYPDAADPLGINWRNGQDAYWTRYQHLDAEGDGFDFPHTVFDGVTAIEGIPDAGAPYVSTRDAYEDAFEERLARESPASIDLEASQQDGKVVAHVTVASAGPVIEGGRVSLFAALVEDPVDYAPPPALSNGVTVHPFVVRDVQERPQTAGGQWQFNFSLADDWQVDRLLVAAWLQQGAVDSAQAAAHEVLQAGMVHVDGPPSSHCGAQRAVLMEMYSATWCDTCLFGDRVAEEMAAQAGILQERTEARAAYLVDVPLAWLWVVLAAAAGVALAVVKLPGGKP